MADPLKELAHHHRELSGLLIAVRGALVRVERGESKLDDELHELRDGIEGFRESLLEHFAREQEGLFPFVAARIPAERARTDELIAEHDRIAEALTTLLRDLGRIDSSGELGPFRATLAHFEELYASHSRGELGFLEDVAAALASDASAMEQLRAHLDEG